MLGVLYDRRCLLLLIPLDQQSEHLAPGHLENLVRPCPFRHEHEYLLPAGERLPYDLPEVLPYDGLLNEPFQLLRNPCLQSPQRVQMPPPSDGFGPALPQTSFKVLIDLDKRLQRQPRTRAPRNGPLLARGLPHSGRPLSHLGIKRRSGLSRTGPLTAAFRVRTLPSRRVSVPLLLIRGCRPQPVRRLRLPRSLMRRGLRHFRIERRGDTRRLRRNSTGIPRALFRDVSRALLF
ncbi:hypothetical protein [Spirillospora sp. NPDC029432]|uniref:hypothetical protein n=1 Tax=Spirillospora sp. NPDC029432 TaxID=3154599 RepID=UPI003452794B